MPAQSHKAVYTAAEHAILDPYKEEYQRASTVSERKLVAQDVLVEIFNYWSDQGVDLYDKEERTRVRCDFRSSSPHSSAPKRLVYWMQNTWRKPHLYMPLLCINTRVLPKSLHKCIWDKPTTQKNRVLPWCRGWLGLVIGFFG